VARDSIKKILKFEKVLEAFCEQIGVEKRGLLHVLMGPRPV
jgi:hypothetical protein